VEEDNHSSNKIYQLYNWFSEVFQQIGKGFVSLQDTNYNSCEDMLQGQT